MCYEYAILITGFSPTIVASTTATRPLYGLNNTVVSAADVASGALASCKDMYAVVIDDISELSA